jgi:hypothetical protein
MKNAVFWDVTLCGSCTNRRFGEKYRLYHQGVNHEVLLARLEFYDINSMEGKLFKSYLTYRYQRILINSNYTKVVSKWHNVK